jgi:O-acetyl-ADP-ribose deacetylase (regulator of RNase III)
MQNLAPASPTRRQGLIQPLMEVNVDFPRLPIPANANGRSRPPAQPRQQHHRDAAHQQAAGGHQHREVIPRYPADLLCTPVSELLAEICYWRDLDARGVCHFDVVKNRLQDIMTRHPPPRPAYLRQANIKEIKFGNLFDDAPPGAALAHCVGADFVMGAGLAVEFRERFGHETELRAGGHQPGTVATIPLMTPGSNEVDRYIFHLVTKPTSRYCLPRWWEIIYSVRELARLCDELKIKTLAMPQIGAGLDRQQWWKVRRVLEIEFAGSNTEVLVFHHPSEHPRNECAGQRQQTALNSTATTTTTAAATAAASTAAASTAATNAAASVTVPVVAPPPLTSYKDWPPPPKQTPKTPTTDRFLSDLEAAKRNSLRRTSPQLVPGRGSALKAANATVAASKGGPAGGRGSRACLQTGAPSSPAPTSTPPLSPGESNPIYSPTPADTNLANKTFHTPPEEKIGSGFSEKEAAAATPTTTPQRRHDQYLSDFFEQLAEPPRNLSHNSQSPPKKSPPKNSTSSTGTIPKVPKPRRTRRKSLIPTPTQTLNVPPSPDPAPFVNTNRRGKSWKNPGNLEGRHHKTPI